MQDSTRGRLYVIAQLALLCAMILPPNDAHWSTPPWVEALGLLAIVAGFAVFLLAGTRLGRSLTANPLPLEHGQLQTGGPYAHVRHPIYSGILLVALGLVLRSGNAVSLLLALGLVAFFHLKAAWEERLLASRYPEYQAYAERTPRFVPRLRRA